jgi:putative transposase
LKLPKLGFVTIVQHREIPDDYKLKSVTVSETPCGHYYASILFEYEAEVVQKPIETVIGFDYSQQQMYVDNDGNVAEYPQYYRKSMKKLAKEQRKLDKRKVGSKNREKQRIKVAKLQEHTANQRKDFQHKKSRKIANFYDLVCIEDLNMQGMSKHNHFGKAVHDNAWGTFTRMLEYKLADAGKQLVKVSRWFPSSKTCSVCGHKKDKFPHWIRTYDCEHCGSSLDRDVNAAINIRREGMRLAGVTV